VRRADELNKKNKRGDVFGVTQFMDLTPAEFRARYLMNVSVAEQQKIKNRNPLSQQKLEELRNAKPPKSFDWTTKGVVTPVKNQAQCGSCWAFSATEEIESVWAIAGHTLPELAPQEFVDCVSDCYGCGGGWPVDAYEYAMSNGQELETNYPYTATTGTCSFNAADVAVKITNYQSITAVASTEETVMVPFVATTAPLSVLVDASTWAYYTGGVLSTCGDGPIDHAVQITGYTTTNGVKVWNVRNSWGTAWGEAGYIWVERDLDLCLIASGGPTAAIA